LNDNSASYSQIDDDEDNINQLKNEISSVLKNSDVMVSPKSKLD